MAGKKIKQFFSSIFLYSFIRSLYLKQINITFRYFCFLFDIQGGIGSVKNITFTNIKVSNVKTPIMIDQFYCDQSSCHNKTDAVSISGITYRGITGTYSYQPIRFACSDSVPCTGLNLLNVHLLPVNWWQYKRNAFCWKSYGEAWGAVEPLSARCLERSNNRLIKILTKPHNYTC